MVQPWDILVWRCSRLLIIGAIKTSPTSDDTTSYKIVAFRKAGIKVLDHIGYIGEDMRVLMKEFKQKKKNELATKKPVT
jgi:hypothetical protein